jgi:P-aminobenzoate N-oxygenase AurF
MCGLAGLSIGPSCPKALLLARRDTTAGGPPSPSPLSSWDRRASVRARPHPRLGAADDAGFPAELVPITNHELVKASTAEVQREIRGRQLFRYLHFTAKLEHLVVNRTALSIAHEASGFELPEWMRLDAYKVYCDEAYHAFVAADLAAEVARREGLEVDWRASPYFLRRLEELCEEAGPDLSPVLEMLFVICSETLISGTLSNAAEAPGLSTPIRQALTDHAHDERRHHAYFSALLNFAWPQLTPSTRRRAGVYVPRLIDAFLQPDLQDLEHELTGHGFSTEEIACILGESYPAELVRDERRHIARHTIRYFERLGAFEDPRTTDAFISADLLAVAP